MHHLARSLCTGSFSVMASLALNSTIYLFFSLLFFWAASSTSNFWNHLAPPLQTWLQPPDSRRRTRGLFTDYPPLCASHVFHKSQKKQGETYKKKKRGATKGSFSAWSKRTKLASVTHRHTGILFHLLAPNPAGT
ncbi:uncharacterized protein B0T15DRAFT_30158 [Chaetomium strumarium]|uniref:Uncharacterized protein n=1 Tax=Chaetomium strumarium TaxID=1170767 RepID=A0AAJ0H2B6_9PEZI|nr:hypothetical protein B0T15DRAFT_30158 [Chaetomium strumarium]